MCGCINTLVAKDFRGAQDGDTWKPENCPLSEGMVDFTRYFRMSRQTRIAVPLSLHLEYPLGGAERRAARLTVAKDRVIEATRKDLHFLRKRLA